MTPGEFDALAQSDSRFYIRESDDGWDLVERATGNVVFNDAMQPEDATLVRDLYPLVELLNSPDPRDAELARLRAEVERLTRERDAATEEVRRQCERANLTRLASDRMRAVVEAAREMSARRKRYDEARHEWVRGGDMGAYDAKDDADTALMVATDATIAAVDAYDAAGKEAPRG